MRSPSFLLNDELAAYVRSHSDGPNDLERQLIAETADLTSAGMQISPEQGRFLAMLVRLSGAKRILEIGTFTGYSALVMARAMGPDGLLLACDISEEWTSIGRRYWAAAGISDRIDLRLAPATDTLSSLDPDRRFDLVFIDADKESYPAYLEAVVPRLVTGGVLLADNVLWHGRIVNHDPDVDTAALQAFNDMASSDARLETLLLPTFDGLTIALRR